ncbi:hypothetical protein BDZ45DRAFT_808004 [Acephala macrosclerotiorum]|nr:hypothetical protein BDZ45DRAFT_808004 [Acephala macrosclerotiorum]
MATGNRARHTSLYLPALLLEHFKSAHKNQCENCNDAFNDEEALTGCQPLVLAAFAFLAPLLYTPIEYSSSAHGLRCRRHDAACGNKKTTSSHRRRHHTECQVLLNTGDNLAEHTKLHLLVTTTMAACGQGAHSKYKYINCDNVLSFWVSAIFSRHVTKMHTSVLVISASTETDSIPDPGGAENSGLDSYNTSIYTSSEGSFHDAPLSQTYALPQTNSIPDPVNAEISDQKGSSDSASQLKLSYELVHALTFNPPVYLRQSSMPDCEFHKVQASDKKSSNNICRTDEEPPASEHNQLSASIRLLLASSWVFAMSVTNKVITFQFV